MHQSEIGMLLKAIQSSKRFFTNFFLKTFNSRSVSSILLRVIFILFIFILKTTNLIAATYVSGVIDQDTIWNTAGSPYILTGNVYIYDGRESIEGTYYYHDTTLTIESGVEVDCGNYYIKVGDYYSDDAGNK